MSNAKLDYAPARSGMSFGLILPNLFLAEQPRGRTARRAHRKLRNALARAADLRKAQKEKPGRLIVAAAGLSSNGKNG